MLQLRGRVGIAHLQEGNKGGYKVISSQSSSAVSRVEAVI